MLKGKLKIKNSGSATIKSEKKEYHVPREYHFANRDMHGLDCEFELTEGIITKIIVNGKELTPEKSVLQAKEENKSKREAEVARQKEEAKAQRYIEQKSGNNNNVNTHDIFDIEYAIMPLDARNLGLTSIDNFALKLNKGAYFDKSDYDHSKWKFYFSKTTRKGYVAKIAVDYGEINQRFNDIAQRQLHSAKAICPNNIPITFKPDWRLIVGLGNESVYETSITLHHVYGFPYIPSSSIKGVVRSWIITEIFEGKEGAAIRNKGFCKLFGCPEKVMEETEGGKGKKEHKSFDGEAHAGDIVFFDAYPLTPPIVEPDIMNPHYSKYYAESSDKARTAPVDYDNPIPVNFLTVIGTPFQFIVGLRRGKPNVSISLEENDSKPILEMAADWLKKALTEHGIGAKTAVGYGYMQ